jgi:hypothetical protein
MSDLVLGNPAFLLDVETAHKEVPFTLVASWCGNADLGRRWWRHAFHTCNTNLVLANLLHLDVGDVGCDVAVVVEWSLNLIQ